MYLYLLSRQEVEELRHYRVCKNKKETHVYTMTSEEKSNVICGVYKKENDAMEDLNAIKEADEAYNTPKHKFINYTNAGRKIYEDQCIRYSVRGGMYQTYFVAIKGGVIVSISPKKDELNLSDGAEVREVIKIGGKFYNVNERPVHLKTNESIGESN